MQVTKFGAAVVAYLSENGRLFDSISTGLSILQFKIKGAVKFLSVESIVLPSRGEDPAVVVNIEVDNNKLSMIDSMFLQSLVIQEAHFEEMKKKVTHSFDFGVKGGKTESFDDLFFFEDVDDKGLRDSDLMKPMHKALGLDENTTDDYELKDLNLELVGIMVNKRREDDVDLMDHEFPRSKAGSYPQYRTLREKFEDNGGNEIYTIGQYTEDYKELHGKNPNISGIVNVARNWTFTPIFVDKSGKIIKG